MLGPGSVLGVYQLLERLAVGGMAEIFLARRVAQAGFEKTVVVKRILPQLAQNDEFVHMFLDEARLAAQLHHPNIAHVYDVGVDEGLPYFVMEWVQGRELREVMYAAAGSGGLPLEHAIKIVVSVAAALHHAHERLGPDHRSLGIVHRDVSPSNVLVTYDGGVKLLDFGVAKAARRRTETLAGTLKGKIAYMSPEQCRGEEVDRRSDVFALGILLYELTTGLRLYSRRSELAMLQEIVGRDAPRPSSRIPGYPQALERIVVRALRRDAGERYQTAEELALDLEQLAAQSHLLLSQVELRRYMRQLFPGSQAEPRHQGLLLPSVSQNHASSSSSPSSFPMSNHFPFTC